MLTEITVGLENTTYTVPEDGGVVQVCVEILEGQLEQEAEVTLATNDGSAAGNDMFHQTCVFGVNSM